MQRGVTNEQGERVSANVGAKRAREEKDENEDGIYLFYNTTLNLSNTRRSSSVNGLYLWAPHEGEGNARGMELGAVWRCDISGREGYEG